VASTGYATWQVPEAPLTSPELLQEQLQIRIRNIPVPTSSPRYQQFKEYYMREHDIQLQEYKVLAKQHSNSASFNWRAMLHGLGVGSMMLAAGLAVLEYHCGLISYWMEAAEDCWCDCQQRRAVQRAKSLELADHRKVERLLQEIGEEEGPTGKAARDGAKRRPKDANEVSARRSKPEAVAFPPSQPLPKEAAKACDPKTSGGEVAKDTAESANPALLLPKQGAQDSNGQQTAGVNAAAATMREQIRSKVIERHCQQIAATQESTSPAEEKEISKQEKVSEVREAKNTPTRKKGKKENEVQRKRKEASEEVLPAMPTAGAKKTDTKKSRDPDVEAALQKLAKTAPLPPDRGGPELLREAQELLSRLEAEDFLRELETEEERAKRAAGKKKAKKARAKAKDKKTEPEVATVEVKAPEVEVRQSPSRPPLPPVEVESSESEAEVEEKVINEDKHSNPSSVEDSTEIQSLDDDHRSSSDSERSSSKKEPSELMAETASSEKLGFADPNPNSWGAVKRGRTSWADVKDEGSRQCDHPRKREVKRPAPVAQTTPTPPSGKRNVQAAAKTGPVPAPRARRETREAPWSAKVEEAPRRRPCNYAEAAGGHRIPAEVQELMTSMGIAGSRDDLIAFLNANSSKEWRSQKGDLSAYSMKDLATFVSELLKRLSEQPKPEKSATGFDGAVAGAQILEWVLGGKKEDAQATSKEETQDVAQSHLRAEAPEFVPSENTEVGQPIMAVAMPAELPPGCQIVMVPVQLAQMPQNMVFEEQMSSEMPMAMMPGPPYGGMQMMAMPCELQLEPEKVAPDAPAPATAEEKTSQYCGYNTDDECESIFGDAAETTMRRQLTF